MQEIRFTFRKQYKFDRLCSIKAKKAHTNQSILQVLLLFSNRNDSHVIDATCFDECLLFSCLNWKMLLLTKVFRYPEILSTAILLLSLKQAFQKKSVFYVFYIHSAILLTVKCKYQSSQYTKFIFDILLQLTYFVRTVFTLFLFFDCSTLFFMSQSL